MDQENLFLNRSELNVEKLLKEKRIAKFYIIWASLGVFGGLSATLTFFFHYKLALTPGFALLSTFMAIFVIYIHVQLLRDIWQIWTYQLKYWYIATLVFQFIYLICFIYFLVLAIYYKQALSVESYYVTCVWIFMCWKWTFTTFFRTKKIRTMFTRYSLIGGGDDEISE